MGSRAADDASVAVADLVYQFGQPVRYLPAAGGGGREITAILTPEETELETDERTERQVERVWVTVYRSETTGIARPAQGDKIEQPGDATPRPLVYQGRIRGQSDAMWELLFARPRHVRIGPRERS